MLSSHARRTARRAVFLGLLIAGLGLTVNGAWIPLKAVTAQILLWQAWQKTAEDGQLHKPWPWADHWPVARLSVPAHDVDQIVLAGDSGNVLAFAPGQNMRASAPGEGGTSVISGHRDTHFRFLRQVGLGERITIETTANKVEYIVAAATVVDSSKSQINLNPLAGELLLVTCYPFDTPIVGGPLRYVVKAVPVASAGQQPTLPPLASLQIR